jgi:aconitate hydratase
MYLGVRLVIAKSFERIHSANLINFGILPLYFVNEADYDSFAQGAEFEIKNLRSAVESGSKEIQINISGKNYMLKMDFSERQRKILLDGGLLNYTKKVQK